MQSHIIRPNQIGSVSHQVLDGVSSYALDDLYSPSTDFAKNIVMDLAIPFYEPNPFFWFDKSKFGNNGDISGAIWVRHPSGLLDLSFDDIDDFVEITATVLNFTSEDFSIIIRFLSDTKDATRILLIRGLSNVDGWFLDFQTANRVEFVTAQAAAQQVTVSSNDSLTTATWYTVGISRSGTSVKIYIDGVEDTASASTHTDPATSSRTVKVGIFDDLSSNAFGGRIHRIIFLKDKELSADEQLNIHRILRSQTR
ncbi:hypothetical protein LCGC14_1231520 [marine sediment metagenome]|uniref:LamG-like jellyroll fold domain-containing protein n=1 Tax=marine sediment metagenome TaxID=412755 RepID=A0A0F9NQL5_9ZZZZ